MNSVLNKHSTRKHQHIYPDQFDLFHLNKSKYIFNIIL